jgi:hypothetical protein
LKSAGTSPRWTKFQLVQSRHGLSLYKLGYIHKTGVLCRQLLAPEVPDPTCSRIQTRIRNQAAIQ